jgi:hypothetical protein
MIAATSEICDQHCDAISETGEILMAKIQKFQSSNVDPEDEIANLTFAVGLPGGGVKPANAPGDVMVVQALLDLVSNAIPRFTKQVITVNGILTAATQQAIFDYQDLVRRKSTFFWVAKDGRVSPAKEGAKLLAKQEYTIIALNTFPAGIIAAALRFDSPIDFMFKRHPQLIPFLKR